MKYVFEMVSGAMIYIASFVKIGSGIQKLIWGIHRQSGDLLSPLLFFLNKESRLKITINCLYCTNKVHVPNSLSMRQLRHMGEWNYSSTILDLNTGGR
jgi:hypothetical protein